MNVLITLLQEGAGPLHYAAYNGSEDCVKALLVAGADKDAKDTARHVPLLIKVVY